MNIANVIEEKPNYGQMNAVRRTHVWRDRCGGPWARSMIVAIETRWPHAMRAEGSLDELRGR